MIVYSLRCAKGHAFDAWFRDSSAFGEQVTRGDVRCPLCGSRKVEKALMAPSVKGGRDRGAAEPAEQPAARAAAGLRKSLTELRRKVEENFDYVGKAFPEEARKIHYGEIEERAIYGDSSDEEAEALREEGVEIGRIPWLPRENS